MKLSVLLSILLIFCFWQTSIQAQQLIPYRKGQKWGFSDKNKKIIIPCIYEDVRFFLDDIAKVKKNGKWGLIKKNGKIFLPFEYDIIYAASSKRRIIVCKNGDKSGHGGNWGFIPMYKGQEIPLEYDLIRECGVEDLLAVMKNNKWGAINQFGKIVIPIQYDVENISDHHFQDETNITFQDKQKKEKLYLKLRFQNKLARVKKQSKWGFINAYSTEIIPCQYDFVGEFSEGLVCVIQKKNNILKLGFVNEKGKQIIPLEYDVPNNYKSIKFSEGLVPILKNGKLGYINKNNEVIIPFSYGEAFSFRNNVAVVNTNTSQFDTEYIVINTKNEVITRLAKNHKLINKEFSDGFIRLVKENQTMLINSNGEIISKEEYNDIYKFKLPSFYSKQKLAKVTKTLQNKLIMGFINEKGKKVIPMTYDFDKSSSFIGGFCKIKKDGKWGVIGKKGKVLIDFRYDAIDLPFFNYENKFFTEGLLPVSFAGKWGFINASEKIFVSFKYDEVRNFALGYARVNYKGRWGYINKKGDEFWE